MSSSDNKPGSPEEFERGRIEMERGWESKQENVLPLETAWNEGWFYGRVLKGSRSLTGIQRTGILLIGLQMVGVAAMMFLNFPFPKVGPSLKSIYDRLPDVSLIWALILLPGAAIGLRFCWVALKPSPQQPQNETE
jgi:hypothetical protein